MGRAKKIHMCKACLYSQSDNYGNTCPECGVVKQRVCFPSKVEHRRGALLRRMEMNGEISDLKFHPKYPLIINGIHVDNYTADTEYTQNSQHIIEDVKPRGLLKGSGFIDKVAALKIGIFEAIYLKTVHIVRKA